MDNGPVIGGGGEGGSGEIDGGKNFKSFLQLN